MEINKLKVKFITDKKGNKKEVILPINEFESLLEDLHDLAIIAERREEKTISHKELLEELKRDGLI